jgi:cytochrome b subunit of formate dehydrogenase
MTLSIKNALKGKNWRFILMFLVFATFLSLLVFKLPVKLFAQDNDECLGCHEDKTLKSSHVKNKSLFVDKKKLGKSIHNGVKCIDCHADLKGSDFPHAEKLKKPQCGSCHKNEQNLYNECLHGKSYNKGDKLAPTCKTCHGSHEIYAIADKRSTAYPLNVPKLCGQCHKEGSPVQLQRNIPQSHILENYAESIHGEGLIKKGLTVSATCASCHSPHRILPHTDPRSTIARQNIAATCTKCHAAIENVHKKVINNELWKKESKVLPACIDCHQPHKVRKVFYEQNLSDASCKKCHEDQSITHSSKGKLMFVTDSDLKQSVHPKLSCTQCHTTVNPTHKRPCDNIQQKVDCSSCHTEIGDIYKKSIHGLLFSKGDPDAPNCAECHGTHKILKKNNQNSYIFPLNIPKLCSKCHQEGAKAAIRIKGTEHSITKHYSESIHGKGLVKSGLTVTATCADCHSAHKELPKKNPESSVNHKNIAGTCGTCHFGIQETFDKSIHSAQNTSTDKPLPSCDDCHSAHTIKRTDQNNFRREILNTCGKCHKEITETYFETYHGKVSLLGSSKAAKCSDCHGSHNIMGMDHQNSMLSKKNKLATCQKCHPNATESFTSYLPHAKHHDKAKYPILFFTFWGMTLLLLSTFTISFIHTLLWLPRSLQMRKKMKMMHKNAHDNKEQKLYQRFTGLNRLLHFTMIVSFLNLALTGMILKFSYTPWAKNLAMMFGGVENAGAIHRLAATALFIVFGTHIYDLLRRKKSDSKSWKQFLLGSDSMVPSLKDWHDAKASIKWFLGKGERPNYGRWTYWEKFDYFAVFWGIFIIGSTGLTLWFPEFLTKFLPGSFINVATIVHSDEALLAAGFIFTVHFFNTHFRPEKFPMDTVIFSGQMTLEELEFERPHEYKELVESGQLEKYMTPPFSNRMLKLLKVFGFAALIIGLSMVGWIIYAMLVLVIK